MLGSIFNNCKERFLQTWKDPYYRGLYLGIGYAIVLERVFSVCGEKGRPTWRDVLVELPLQVATTSASIVIVAAMPMPVVAATAAAYVGVGAYNKYTDSGAGPAVVPDVGPVTDVGPGSATGPTTSTV
jgi:hypothetical protein